MDNIGLALSTTIREHIEGQDLGINILIDSIETWALTNSALKNTNTMSENQGPLVLSISGPIGVGKYVICILFFK